jgi:cyanuric acid amidohydrolase
MADAGILHAEDVHWVQVKCPLLTAERVQTARRAGQEPVTEVAYKSMAYSRGASALGVAAALGEIGRPVAEDAVLSDWSLASAVASASAGIELKNNVVIVPRERRSTSAGQLRSKERVVRAAMAEPLGR